MFPKAIQGKYFPDESVILISGRSDTKIQQASVVNEWSNEDSFEIVTKGV